MRFRRAKRDRWLLGVCGGLAYSQGWSPNLVRLVTVVLSFAIPGISLVPVLILYIALGAILPESDEF